MGNNRKMDCNWTASSHTTLSKCEMKWNCYKNAIFLTPVSKLAMNRQNKVQLSVGVLSYEIMHLKYGQLYLHHLNAITGRINLLAIIVCRLINSFRVMIDYPVISTHMNIWLTHILLLSCSQQINLHGNFLFKKPHLNCQRVAKHGCYLLEWFTLSVLCYCFSCDVTRWYRF